MEERHIDIVVRCRNEMPLVERMVGRLLRQRECVPRITFLDCGATDASRRVAAHHALRIVDVSSSARSPGAIMNHAMRKTTSPIVAFINADAIPLSETSIMSLVAHLQSTPLLAAAFGRQIERQSSLTSLTRELLREGAAFAAFRSGGSFSMAAAVVNRSAWFHHPFDERLRYAEDLEWTTRVRRDGWATTYVAGAPFEQSQDSTLRRHFARPHRPPPIPRGARTGAAVAKHVAMLGALVSA